MTWDPTTLHPRSNHHHLRPLTHLAPVVLPAPALPRKRCESTLLSPSTKPVTCEQFRVMAHNLHTQAPWKTEQRLKRNDKDTVLLTQPSSSSHGDYVVQTNRCRPHCCPRQKWKTHRRRDAPTLFATYAPHGWAYCCARANATHEKSTHSQLCCWDNLLKEKYLCFT